MRRLSLLFARRYLFSRRSHSVINIISGVSAFAVGVPVAAMVILLSVFNGFEGLVKNMYGEFDPDIAISPTQGKVFERDSVTRSCLLAIDGVDQVSYVLEENGLLEYRGRQFIGMVRGVDSMYKSVVPIEDMVVNGKYELHFGDMQQVVVGRGIAYNLGINTALYDPVSIYTPRRGSFSSLLPIDAYKQRSLFPAGVFALDAETDTKYVIAPLEFAQELFDYPGRVSSIMVKLKDGADQEKVRAAIATTLGDEFKVLNRYQQKASLYKIMSYEKWGIFFIILLVLIIASFSVIGSLVMLIIDKQKDIRTIITLGAGVDFVRRIFIAEGMMISLIGAVGGMTLGLLFCWVQIRFGLITIPAQTFLVDSYPVVVKLSDMAGVVVTFVAVNYIITKFTVVKMIAKSRIRV